MGRSAKIRELLLATAIGIALVSSAAGSASATPGVVSDLTRKQFCNRLQNVYNSIFASGFMCTMSSVVTLSQQGIDLSTLGDACRQSVKGCKRTFFPKADVCTSDSFGNAKLTCGAKVKLLDSCFTDLETRFANLFAPLNDLITCSIFDPLTTGDVAGFQAEVTSLTAAVQQAQAKIQIGLGAPLPKSCKRLQKQCAVLQTVTQ